MIVSAISFSFWTPSHSPIIPAIFKIRPVRSKKIASRVIGMIMPFLNAIGIRTQSSLNVTVG